MKQPGSSVNVDDCVQKVDEIKQFSGFWQKKGYIARELLKRIWTLDIDWLNMYFATRISIGYAAIMHLRDDTIQG